MNARFPLVLPFALLASLVAGCSSSSGGGTSTDGGTKDTGIIPTIDGGGTDTGKKDTGGSKPDATGGGDTGGDTGMTGTDGGGGIVITPAAGSKLIVKGIVQVIGVTDDDYIIYYDPTTLGVSAADTSANVTVIAPGPTTDGGIGPQIVGLGGNIVAILTDYTTKSVMGNTEAVEGTLSIWSHTKTGGVLKQVATHSTGIINIATDSSFVAFTDASDAAGANGNMGVVGGDGTGATDIAIGVKIDTSAATCEPFAIFDGKYVVATTCANLDGGDGAPSISSYDSTNAWAPTLLTATAGPTAPFSTTGNSVNFTTDTAGDNVLTVTPLAGGTLSVQPIAGGAATSLTTTLGSIAGGVEYFYLAPDSSFALFTNADGSLGRSAFATPTSVPVTTTIAPAASVAGVFYTSPDTKYEIDYATAIATDGVGPSTLNLRSTTTGTAFPLIVAGSGLASSFPGGFTADSSYALVTTGLKVVGSADLPASVGTLKVASVADGTITTIVNNQTVWDAIALTGTKILYNQNYLESMFTMAPNGAAFGDMYIADATMASEGTLLVAGADAPNGFYLSHDKTKLFYSFTQLNLPDGGTVGTPVTGDGLYVVTLP